MEMIRLAYSLKQSFIVVQTNSLLKITILWIQILLKKNNNNNNKNNNNNQNKIWI